MSWYDRALCIGMVTKENDPFDVDDSVYEAPDNVKSLCEQCPVRIECLLDAIRNNDQCVRAGLTKRQRDALKRPLKRTKCPTCKNDMIVCVPNTILDACAACGITWRTVIAA